MDLANFIAVLVRYFPNATAANAVDFYNIVAGEFKLGAVDVLNLSRHDQLVMRAQLDPTVQDHVRNQSKIQAIKALRAVAPGATLMESKLAIEDKRVGFIERSY